MQGKISRSLKALAGLIVYSSVASAQSWSIAGKVIGEDGKPLKDAIIHIDRKDIKGAYKTKSDKKGEFIHAGLPLGTYDVSIEVGGKVIDQLTARSVRTRLGDPTPVDFDLAGWKKKSDAINAAASTGTLTKEQARDMSPEQ